ncbi:MAG: universal stress protein [Paludibacteraceae bacterium]|nr:universal stress protein [Paludibacteraceae bacterium]
MIWDNNEDIRVIECANDRRVIQRQLNACREERRPYIFITNTMNIKPLRRLLVPVSMLEEETYKAEISTYIARKTGAHIILLQANDYGSKARQNVNRIVTHIEHINERIQNSAAESDTGDASKEHLISYEIAQARKDSFSLIREASERQRDFQHDLLILTASRDYGLDDILFGPPERKAIQHAIVPVMLVNPREDLFSLCD